MLLLLHVRAYGDISVYIVGMSLLSCRYATLAHTAMHPCQSLLCSFGHTHMQIQVKKQICPMFIYKSSHVYY
jgi:hypothetical protein